LELILGFGAGWIIAYYFFRRRRSGSDRVYQKLSMDAKNFILNDPREKLGLADIIALFYDKIISEHLDSLDQPFPYKRCPKCGSKKVRRFILRPDGTLDLQGAPTSPPIAGEEFTIQCRSCGYQDAVKTRQDSRANRLEQRSES
jgi:DNA-directed RNA polymerase subunit RPC12/RpoP